MAGRRLFRGSAWALLMALAGAGSLPADEWAFDFGTPDSPTREGFTKVTKADTYAPGRVCGFESADGLLDVDRSGSYWPEKKRHATNAYLAQTYGEYRVTSYTTCDFVEGTQDNAFLLSLPDGEYEVWAVVTDPAEAPPFFEIRANGQTKHNVRLARRGFIFMQPFEARAEGGVLRLELKGPHGWLLSALVVGTPGEAVARTVSESTRSQFSRLPRCR